MSVVIVDWKVEPESPLTYVNEDVVLFDDSLTNDENLTAFDLESSIVKDENQNGDSFEINNESELENKSEVFGKLLEEIEDFHNIEEFIKDESFSTWFEEKSNLPIFEDLQIEPSQLPQRPVQTFRLKEESKPAFNQYQSQVTSQDTNVLLREFETVFDNVELSHNTLTPPQSPPQISQEPQIIATLQPIGGFVNPGVYYQQISRTGTQINSDLQPATPQPDVAHELAVVEELVRSRAENLVYNWEEQKNLPPSSPSSNSSSSFSEYSSDPEWIPETINSPEYIVRTVKVQRKRASKPYSRVAPEDKKSRKKEQNKNAATRYRMKKKQEIEEILSEEKELQDKHDGLENKVTDLQREIKYLKSLMRDLFKAKGLIS